MSSVTELFALRLKHSSWLAMQKEISHGAPCNEGLVISSLALSLIGFILCELRSRRAAWPLKARTVCCTGAQTGVRLVKFTNPFENGSSRIKRTPYRIQLETREALARRLTEELEKEPAISFGYLYGSVVDSDTIHDVDVGLYLRESEAATNAAIAVDLSNRLTALVGMPVDVRVLNEAPLSFVYHVLRGRLLVCRDEACLTEMLEDVARRYLDLAPLLRQGTKDAFAA
jgi:predicted nucleotidyltransferase